MSILHSKDLVETLLLNCINIMDIFKWRDLTFQLSFFNNWSKCFRYLRSQRNILWLHLCFFLLVRCASFYHLVFVYIVSNSILDVQLLLQTASIEHISSFDQIQTIINKLLFVSNQMVKYERRHRLEVPTHKKVLITNTQNNELINVELKKYLMRMKHVYKTTGCFVPF